MKQISILILLLSCSVGCAKKVNAPIPGQINSFDATSYRALSDAQAVINSVKSDVNSGALTLSDSQKAVFNKMIADYNVGESAWQAYHAGATNDTAALETAIDNLVSDIAKVATDIQGGGK